MKKNFNYSENGGYKVILMYSLPSFCSFQHMTSLLHFHPTYLLPGSLTECSSVKQVHDGTLKSHYRYLSFII